ncbi:MAG TPA: S41 family peptidase [Steroidobacteraceae bacterium]|nr:S41 family peptidase [Steroidobacteraceae bacterium]
MGTRVRLLLTLGTGVLAGVALSMAGRVFADRATAPVPSYLAPGAEYGALPWQDARLLAEVLQRVRESYVDAVDDHQLMRQAVHGMVESLDEHSALLEPGDYEQLQAATSGSYAGIGVEVNGVAEGVRIVRCLPESPAVQAGLKIDDLIVRIDDLAVSAANIDAATTQLRGRPGSEVRLSVRRGQAPSTLEFRLQRSLVELPSIAAELVAPGVGYLRISEFTDGTAGEVDAAMPRLRAAAGGGLRGLIIDLRNNPGGVLEAATAVADDFLDSGTIVSAEGRLREARFRMDATPGDIAAGAPIVVLVNGSSASASEILAAALRQNGRATLVGRKTYGKGTVQTIMPLSGGEALKLTTSRYFTPSGTSINGIGIMPDVELRGVEAAPAPPDAPNTAPTLARRDTQVAAALAELHRPTRRF